MFSIAGLLGCGGKNAEHASESAPKAAKVEPAPQEKTAEVGITVDPSGRRWLTPEIPYDVYPELPAAVEVTANASALEPAERMTGSQNAIASVGAATSQSTTQRDPEVGQGADTPAGTSSSTDGTGGGWDQVLPQEVLQSEIAAVRNRLGEHLLTVGTYNSSFEDVANAGWEMSALATIVSEYPAAISWKEKALLARDAAVGIAMAATARGRENFKSAQLASEQVSAILNNNFPPGLGEPDPDTSREETADRAALMNRIQSAFDHLKEAGATEASLKSEAELAIHEARLLAALSKFTADADYTAAENADYQAAASELVKGGSALADATGAGDFVAFQSTLDRVNNACNQCHSKYRFSN